MTIVNESHVGRNVVWKDSSMHFSMGVLLGVKDNIASVRDLFLPTSIAVDKLFLLEDFYSEHPEGMCWHKTISMKKKSR